MVKIAQKYKKTDRELFLDSIQKELKMNLYNSNYL